MHYFDPELGSMTLTLKLDLNMVVTYCMLKIRSIGQAVQKLSLGYTYTHIQTDRHTHTYGGKTFTYQHTQAVIKWF